MILAFLQHFPVPHEATSWMKLPTNQIYTANQSSNMGQDDDYT